MVLSSVKLRISKIPPTDVTRQKTHCVFLSNLPFLSKGKSFPQSQQTIAFLCFRFIFRKLKDRIGLLRAIGQQEFDMPKNVMDVLYNQALCWIGIFFSPFIPLFITAKLFLFFWIKRVRFIFLRA